MKDANAKYQVAYKAALESGIRLVEIKKLIESVKKGDYEINGDVVMVMLGYFRRVKLTCIAFISRRTLERLNEINNEFSIIRAAPPKSIADFCQGRMPQKVGVKYHADLIRRAKLHYEKYLDYVKSLKRSSP